MVMISRIFLLSRQSVKKPTDATPAGRQAIRAQEGYTLIETIIAMALFLSVLIPLIGIMGNMMFDKKSPQMNKAFSIAVSEMNMVADSKEFVDQKLTVAGFIVQRTVQKLPSLVEVKITIQTEIEPPKDILVLRRLFLAYP